MECEPKADIKQVICVRSDLKMRRGKEIAQGSHASMAFLLNRMRCAGEHEYVFIPTEEQSEWLFSGSFKKVCLRVDSEQELDEIFKKAKATGLTVEMIIDSGHTEFHGVKTKTCIAIGPHYSSKIDPITGHLKLY
jgi:PTH2 family peptidyl-tRNA hydrolase